jgi:hypothetical protein
MRRLTLSLTLMGAILLAFSGATAAQNSSAPATSQQPAKGENDVIPDQYIVVLKDKEDSKKDPTSMPRNTALRSSTSTRVRLRATPLPSRPSD